MLFVNMAALCMVPQKNSLYTYKHRAQAGLRYIKPVLYQCSISHQIHHKDFITSLPLRRESETVSAPSDPPPPQPLTWVPWLCADIIHVSAPALPHHCDLGDKMTEHIELLYLPPYPPAAWVSPIGSEISLISQGFHMESSEGKWRLSLKPSASQMLLLRKKLINSVCLSSVVSDRSTHTIRFTKLHP